MTFAEIVIFVLLAIVVVFVLSPLQKKLEKRLYKLFRSKASGSGPIIDVTDYSKHVSKENSKKENPNG